MMNHVTSNDGTRIGFVRSGTGPALLLVHGTTADHSRWAPISPRFEQHFTVYALDRRGRGKSTDAPDYNILREAEDVASVIEATGEPTNVLGHSFGAICCLEASLLTDKIRRLVLYEPPLPTGTPLYPPDVPGRMQALIYDGRLEAALEVFMREVVNMPDYELEKYRQLPVWKVRVTLAPTIPRELLFDQYYTFDPQNFINMTVPTLLLLGGNSPPVFSRATEMVHAALPSSRIVRLPGQQHIAMDTNPALFVSEVENFFLE